MRMMVMIEQWIERVGEATRDRYESGCSLVLGEIKRAYLLSVGEGSTDDLRTETVEVSDLDQNQRNNTDAECV